MTREERDARIRNLLQPIRLTLDRAKECEEAGADADFSDMLDDSHAAMEEIVSLLGVPGVTR